MAGSAGSVQMVVGDKWEWGVCGWEWGSVWMVVGGV